VPCGLQVTPRSSSSGRSLAWFNLGAAIRFCTGDGVRCKVQQDREAAPGNGPSLPISAEQIAAGASEVGSPLLDLVSLSHRTRPIDPVPCPTRGQAEERGQRDERALKSAPP
jgi:hypothetical protein